MHSIATKCFFCRHAGNWSKGYCCEIKEVEIGDNEVFCINSLTAKSILAGEKLVLFGSYLLIFYVGIVHYILREPKTWHAKIYFPTQCTNWQILTSAKKIRFWPSTHVIDAASFVKIASNSGQAEVIARSTGTTAGPAASACPHCHRCHRCAIVCNAQGGVQHPCGQVMIDPANPKKGSKYCPTSCLISSWRWRSSLADQRTTNTPMAMAAAVLLAGQWPPRRPESGYLDTSSWTTGAFMTFRSGNTPLGLFTSKNFATTISPWVVTAMALEPYDCVMVEQGRDDVSGDPVPLEYLRDPNYGESWEHHCQHPSVSGAGWGIILSLASFRSHISRCQLKPTHTSPHLLLFCLGIFRCKNNTANFCLTSNAGSYDVNLSVLLRPSSSSARQLNADLTSGTWTGRWYSSLCTTQLPGVWWGPATF